MILSYLPKILIINGVLKTNKSNIESDILKENYRMSNICKDREALRLKYEQFIQTERGKEWKHFW